MYHTSQLFKTTAPEWLIYFNRTRKNFSISMLGESDRQDVSGAYQWSGNINLALEITGRERSFNIDLMPDKSAERGLAGTLLVDGKSAGHCSVEDSHSDTEPVIQLDSKILHWEFAAFRSIALDVSCPLLIQNGDDLEAVIENVEMLYQNRNRHLPNLLPKKYFIGSCRHVRPLGLPSTDNNLEGISLVIAITELLVKDHFMQSLG